MGEKLGQHFLSNHTTAKRTAELLGLTEKDIVLEIGPGKGMLTDYLLMSGASIEAVEIDAKLHEYLQKRYRGRKAVFHNEDILKSGISRFSPTAVCGNLPYQICGKIINMVLRTEWNWQRAVFMVPAAVGERLVAQPGDSEYSQLSVIAGINSEARLEFYVGSDEFDPPPKIKSAVVYMKKKSSFHSPEYYKLIKGLFTSRRKKIRNNLKVFLGISSDRAEKLLSDSGISGDVRPQDISGEAYAELLKAVVNEGFL